jgi:hypothetical protein
MKRSELQVGDILFYARPVNWGGSHIPATAKVEVLAVEPHRRKELNRREISQIDRGNGVLIAYVNSDCRTDVVQLAHLRGPYDEVVAQVRRQAAVALAEREAARERAVQRRALAAENDTARTAVTARAEAAGFIVRADYSDRVARIVSVDYETLAALLDRIDELQAG